jgi:hypothetical protein
MPPFSAIFESSAWAFSVRRKLVGTLSATTESVALGELQKQGELSGGRCAAARLALTGRELTVGAPVLTSAVRGAAVMGAARTARTLQAPILGCLVEIMLLK